MFWYFNKKYILISPLILPLIQKSVETRISKEEGAKETGGN